MNTELKVVHDIEIPEKPVLRMPKLLLSKWLAALRSGEYTQSTNWLYDTQQEGYCCLGVLQHCEDGKVEGTSDDEVGLPSRAWLTSKGISGSGLKAFYDVSHDYPVADVLIRESHFKQGTEMSAGWVRAVSLAGINDDGAHTFPQIADIIESITETY